MPHDIVVSPNFRYYKQSAADFYALVIPRVAENYSSDSRLADHDSVSVGVSFAKTFGPVKLRVSYDHYEQELDNAPDRFGQSSFTSGVLGVYNDYAYDLISAALYVTWK